MILDKLEQPCFSTTLMGVIRGVLNYYGVSCSDAMLYGGTGHAFLINIHDQICPSGPYCWSYDGLYRMLQNFGITMLDLGFYSPESSKSERNRVEKLVREHLDRKSPCSMLNMENQLIVGYESDHFVAAAPWPMNPDFPPRRLTFGSWAEFGEEYHCSFFTYKLTGEFDQDAVIRDSLQYALELYLTPSKYSNEPYSGGISAYDQWIQAIRDGHGQDQGNWWNAIVWGECRARAAAYLDEIGHGFSEAYQELASHLSEVYRLIAHSLKTVSERELSDSRKVELLQEIKHLELEQLERLKSLIKMY